MELHGPVLAVLTVIGGLDTRPRLGGLVQHDHLGVGTIAKIENKGKVTVVFHGRKAAKMCVLGVLKPVSVKLLRVSNVHISSECDCLNLLLNPSLPPSLPPPPPPN